MTTKTSRFFKVSRFADKGKKCEEAVHAALKRWAEIDLKHREVNRLLDTRAAQRIVKPAPADFDFYAAPWRVFGLIEVKETKHTYRLFKDKVPQYARLMKRAFAGGVCGVVVYHSTLNKFRGVPLTFMMADSDKGSWNLSSLPLVDTPDQALTRVWEGFGK